MKSNKGINKIDHTVAEFDINSLTRGYSVSHKNGVLVYAIKTSDTQANIIVHDSEGLYEFSCFSRNSAQRTAESTAESLCLHLSEL